LIQEGLAELGLTIVKAVRDRFDGAFRNPWNEFECGSNYARSMSSYSLLSALSGFSCDMTKKEISFAPATADGDCEFFFSLDSGWGLLKRKGKTYSVKVLYGSLELNSILLPLSKEPISADLNGETVDFKTEANRVCFHKAVHLTPGTTLSITF